MMIRNWHELPERPLLYPGHHQLWMAWLDEENPGDFYGLLSEDERIRSGRLRSPQIVHRFIAARGILRILLSSYVGYRPENLVFSYGLHGKPDLAGGLKAGLSFNVSHSGGLAVFAIAKELKIGVDIEEIHPVKDLEAAASIFLSPNELEEFQAMPADEKLEQFFKIWTCKEAILKASGEGFSGPVKNILARFCLQERNDKKNIYSSKNMRLTLLDPFEGFTGALACL